MAANKATAAKTRTKKKERKNISAGAAHIQSTFNNTIVTLSPGRMRMKLGRSLPEM